MRVNISGFAKQRRKETRIPWEVVERQDTTCASTIMIRIVIILMSVIMMMTIMMTANLIGVLKSGAFCRADWEKEKVNTKDWDQDQNLEKILGLGSKPS